MTPSEVTVSSRGIFWFFVAGGCVYYYVLFSASLRHDWTYAVYAVLGLMVPYALWALTYVVVIDAERIVVRRGFGLVDPLVVPLSQITELRSHPDSNGRMTRFEVWTRLGRTVQLHMFQANFLAGVSAVRAARADLPERVLDSWSLW